MTRTRWVGLGTVLYLGVLAAAPSWAAFLESPAPAAVVSGIGFISGWKCDASNITVTIDDGEHLPVAMFQERSDLQGSLWKYPAWLYQAGQLGVANN